MAISERYIPESSTKAKSEDKIMKEEFLEVSESRRIPLYDLRDLRSHEPIAKSIADSKRMAMFGGVWGGFKGVKRSAENEGFFMKIKPGRPAEAKVALMIPPKDAIQLIEWAKVHEEFRHLQQFEKFKHLWSSHGGYLHMIGPLRTSLNSLPQIFETTPEDFSKRYPNLPSIDFSTGCFLWKEDPHLKHLAAMVKRYSHTSTYIGVSSLNRHGEEPPYSFEELHDQLRDGTIDSESIDLIVRDSLHEKHEAFGSHTQIRLPLINETPSLKIIRLGTLSKNGFETATGFKTEISDGTKDVRKNPGLNVDNHISEMTDEVTLDWKRQKPQIFIRN